MSKFTDRQLVQLYRELAADYKAAIVWSRSQSSTVDLDPIKNTLLGLVERSLTPDEQFYVEAEPIRDNELTPAKKLEAKGELSFGPSFSTSDQQDDFAPQPSENPMPTLAELDSSEKEKVRIAAKTIIAALQSRDATLTQQPVAPAAPHRVSMPRQTITRTHYLCGCCRCCRCCRPSPPA